MTPTRLFTIVEDLRSHAGEANWFEFKVGNHDPDRLAATISALSNGARLADREMAYLIWGVRDDDHEVVGTSFDPTLEKRGGQELSMWLSQVLKPFPNLQFHAFEHPGGRVVLLEVPAATVAPVAFNGEAYIRLGSATPKLAQYSELQAALWTKLRPFAWERGAAQSYLTGDGVMDLLDYAAYFALLKLPLPETRTGIFERLEADRLISADVGARWNVLNLGAILLAKRLSSFPHLARKTVRVIEYARQDRVETRRRWENDRGYANGFERLIDQVDAIIPRPEAIGKALREERPLYPPIAIRELVANALIHQDLTITGAGPLVEVFPDRVEITNPGKPLVEPSRFMDMPPRSRNEALASLMRRMGMCEEQGSGVDKAVTAVEELQLPPPDFRIDGDNVRTVLLSPRDFSGMTATERLRACFQHAGLRYLIGQRMTNASLRHRFGMDEGRASMVTRVMKDAVKVGLIKLADERAPKSGYVPWWA